MGEIFDVKKQLTGKPGRPKTVRVSRTDENTGVKIVGAQPIDPDHVPEVLDSKSKVEQPPATLGVHEEVVKEGDNSIRGRQADPSSPQVQFRQSDKDEWDQVKKGDE